MENENVNSKEQQANSNDDSRNNNQFKHDNTFCTKVKQKAGQIDELGCIKNVNLI
jgi:hypothetical protein